MRALRRAGRAQLARTVAARLEEAAGSDAGAWKEVTSGIIETSAVNARRFAATIFLSCESRS